MTDPQVMTTIHPKEQTHDILIKAAEDVQEGMWCTGQWFTNNPIHLGFPNNAQEESFGSDEAFDRQVSAGKLSKMHRCAEGSIALSTIIAGLGKGAFILAIAAVNKNLPRHCNGCNYSPDPASLNNHNDAHMAGMDSFSAGAHLAEIFRDTADKVINPDQHIPITST